MSLLATSLHKCSHQSPPRLFLPPTATHSLMQGAERSAMSQLRGGQLMVKSAQENNKIKEIMARYRPIAPMPPLPLGGASTPLHLQSRPCRVRKRGRPSLASFQVAKRPKLFSPPTSTDAVATTTRANSFVPYTTQVPVSTHGFPSVPVSSTKIPAEPVETSKDPLTLSLVPYSGSALIAATTETKRDVPMEKDLLKRVLEPQVILPQAVRPVGSTIFVGCIDPIVSSVVESGLMICKSPEEVEQDMEAETLPTLVSDSENKVRLTNSAYKAMVGQPECLWLEIVVNNPCRRINGGVKLVAPTSMMPEKATAFTCRVKIEWARNGMKNYVCAPCDVRRLCCDSRDYVFIWKLHTDEGYVSSCKAWIKDGAVW